MKHYIVTFQFDAPGDEAAMDLAGRLLNFAAAEQLDNVRSQLYEHPHSAADGVHRPVAGFRHRAGHAIPPWPPADSEKKG